MLEYRSETRGIFYHGLTSYLTRAFPEDELRPVACSPLTRDRANPAHIEVNDVLGNYSLSLVDSLSTLAILASTPTSETDSHDALHDFQRYVSLIVDHYGDGTPGIKGQGQRARGFDLDSKVQVFETTIRGLGGLLSAHLFAMGDLPIRGYEAVQEYGEGGVFGIHWQNVQTARGEKFVYDGQLLRLAYDLGARLLPAFDTNTGIPYPRINLRHGAGFYKQHLQPKNGDQVTCPNAPQTPVAQEITETCSAGAGSLVLEFSVLSRLTGDDRFERRAKRAFWAVWDRRSAIGLIGAGIDADTGTWISSYTGIGAGIDSFFEYAFKSYILLSGLETFDEEADAGTSSQFLQAWETAHAAISRHIYRGAKHEHPHYAQNDLWTGGSRFSWIDSLSAFYPGLLALAGEIEEATSTHLLYAALWQRYGALPERWNTVTGKIDSGLRWWGGRPEFIESTWYLYRSSKDPWYLHVGEMVLKDIKRRCWTPCGWAGLQDVRTGELSDRMESFFLGETAKYLYLLFDEEHPLNHLDAAVVFTTEGHPLIIPPRYKADTRRSDGDPVDSDVQCPVPLLHHSLGQSSVAARPDLYHAAYLARLYENPQTEGRHIIEGGSGEPIEALLLTNHSTNDRIFPWTLPEFLIPWNATSSKRAVQQTFDLTFPTLPNTTPDFNSLQRIDKGILIKSVSGLRFALVSESDEYRPGQTQHRVTALSGLSLGRDEHLYLAEAALAQFNPSDPNFSMHKDIEIVDLIVDSPGGNSDDSQVKTSDFDLNAQITALLSKVTPTVTTAAVVATEGEITTADVDVKGATSITAQDAREAILHLPVADGGTLQDSLNQLIADTPGLDLDMLLAQALQDFSMQKPPLQRFSIPAMLPTGPGAATLPSHLDVLPDPASQPVGEQVFASITIIDSNLCSETFAEGQLDSTQVLVIRRGGCSFSQKLARLPPITEKSSLSLVVVVGGEEDVWSRPFLDEVQSANTGALRGRGLALVLVQGGFETWDLFKRAAAREGLVEVDTGRVVFSDKKAGGGAMGVKRRFWFASNGVRVSNLHVL